LNAHFDILYEMASIYNELVLQGQARSGRETGRRAWLGAARLANSRLPRRVAV
jgi:hypothetical protein